MTDYDTLCNNALMEMKQITNKLPVDEKTCANCKYRSAYGDSRRQEMVLRCSFNNENKFIGRFVPDSLVPKNRRYSLRKRDELLRRKMAHKCKNHIEEYKPLMY